MLCFLDDDADGVMALIENPIIQDSILRNRGYCYPSPIDLFLQLVHLPEERDVCQVFVHPISWLITSTYNIPSKPGEYFCEI